MIYIFPEAQSRNYIFYVSVLLFLGEQTIKVAVKCGRRPGENS